MNTVWIILAVEMDPNIKTETKTEKLELNKVKTHKEFICVEGKMCEGNQMNYINTDILEIERCLAVDAMALLGWLISFS